MPVPRPGRAEGLAWLPVVAIGGQLLVALLTAVLARLLGVGAFEVYAVAAAVFVALLAAAPLGADKLAAQRLPAALAGGDPRETATIVGFALRRTLLGTLAAVAAGLALGLASAMPGLALALAVAAAALPPAVFAHLALELLTASGRPVAPMVALRLGVPATVLALAGLAGGRFGGAPLALAAWGIGWSLAAVLLAARLRRALPGVPLRPAAGPAPADWSRTARALWLHRLATAAMAQAGVLGLALVDAPATEVGAYAAATALVGLALVLSTSTSRAYGRELALLLAAGRMEGVMPLALWRLLWLGPVSALVLVPALLVPGQALTLFRPEFAVAGTGALRILAAAAAVNMTLALAVPLLKLRARGRLLWRGAFAALATQLLLIALLAPAFGAAGVATAYAVASVGQSIFLAVAARRDLRTIGKIGTSRARDA